MKERLHAFSSVIFSFYASLGWRNWLAEPKNWTGKTSQKSISKNKQASKQTTTTKNTKIKISGKYCPTILVNTCFYLICVFFIGSGSNYWHLFPILSQWLLSTSDTNFGKYVRNITCGSFFFFFFLNLKPRPSHAVPPPQPV